MAQVIFLTGASTGFGRDTAETLAKAGHRVFASMRNTAGKNREHADALRAKGVAVVDVDVTDDASVQAGVDAVLADAGRIDVVINNAGIGSLHVSESFTTEQVRDLFDVNVLGVHRVLRATLPALRRQGSGLVINIGSVLGRVSVPFFGVYGATKFAVEALSDTYRYELSQLGIDVVLIQPGTYPTSIFASSVQPADEGRVAAYGQLAAIPEKIMSTVMESFQGDNVPDPHDVAVEIQKLIPQPAGERPDRVVVGQPFGADVLNGTATAVQAQVLEGLGLSFLAKTAVSA